MKTFFRLSNLGEDIFESAKILGAYTCHIHACNWRRESLEEPRHWTGKELTFLSEGDYDFKKFVSILRKEGFDGYISTEHPSQGKKYGLMETAEKEIEFLKSIISELK
jgi:sugar phosphate isomerase/epimerase